MAPFGELVCALCVGLVCGILHKTLLPLFEYELSAEEMSMIMALEREALWDKASSVWNWRLSEDANRVKRRRKTGWKEVLLVYYNKAFPSGFHDGLRATADAKLAVYVGQVELHSADGDVEKIGDSSVGLSTSQ